MFNEVKLSIPVNGMNFSNVKIVASSKHHFTCFLHTIDKEDQRSVWHKTRECYSVRYKLREKYAII